MKLESCEIAGLSWPAEAVPVVALLEGAATRTTTPSLLTCWCQLRKEVADIDELVVEDLACVVQQANDSRVGNRIEDVLRFLASDNDIALPQHRQLLGKGALLNLEPNAKFIYSHFAGPKRIKDSDSHRVSEGLEELRRELRHFRHLYVQIFAY